jgi:hypothetical protein
MWQVVLRLEEVKTIAKELPINRPLTMKDITSTCSRLAVAASFRSGKADFSQVDLFPINGIHDLFEASNRRFEIFDDVVCQYVRVG